jgi:hypothetical protein
MAHITAPTSETPGEPDNNQEDSDSVDKRAYPKPLIPSRNFLSPSIGGASMSSFCTTLNHSTNLFCVGKRTVTPRATTPLRATIPDATNSEKMAEKRKRLDAQWSKPSSATLSEHFGQARHKLVVLPS